MKQDYKERAARAELVAEQLAAALQAEYLRRNWTTVAERYNECDGTSAALDAWTVHQADYDTLDAADSDPGDYCPRCGLIWEAHLATGSHCPDPTA